MDIQNTFRTFRLAEQRSRLVILGFFAWFFDGIGYFIFFWLQVVSEVF